MTHEIFDAKFELTSTTLGISAIGHINVTHKYLFSISLFIECLTPVHAFYWNQGATLWVSIYTWLLYYRFYPHKISWFSQPLIEYIRSISSVGHDLDIFVYLTFFIKDIRTLLYIVYFSSVSKNLSTAPSVHDIFHPFKWQNRGYQIF